MVEEGGRLGVTPVEYWANNAPPNFADLYADRETTVGRRIKSRLIEVSNHPGALVGWVFTLIKRDLAHRQNPPRTKIPLSARPCLSRAAQKKISATANFCLSLFCMELRTTILNNSPTQVSYSNPHPHAPRRAPFCIFGPPTPPPPGDPESPSNPQPARRRGPASPC